MLSLWVLACQKKVASSEGGAVDLVARGRAVYLANCTACHNTDPKLAGALGPDVAHSSLELITARVMRAEYPPGYKPKRNSHVMPKLPQLQADIPALSASSIGQENFEIDLCRSNFKASVCQIASLLMHGLFTSSHRNR